MDSGERIAVGKWMRAILMLLLMEPGLGLGGSCLSDRIVAK
jgi:hypothetical protein